MLISARGAACCFSAGLSYRGWPDSSLSSLSIFHFSAFLSSAIVPAQPWNPSAFSETTSLPMSLRVLTCFRFPSFSIIRYSRKQTGELSPIHWNTINRNYQPRWIQWLLYDFYFYYYPRCFEIYILRLNLNLPPNFYSKEECFKNSVSLWFIIFEKLNRWTQRKTRYHHRRKNQKRERERQEEAIEQKNRIN